MKTTELSKIILTGILVIGLLSFFIILFVILYRQSHKKNIAEKEYMRSQFNQILLESQFEIQQQTLQHVSRELHDNLGQVASLIKINLNTLQLSSISKAEEKIESTKELTRQLIADIKSLSVNLGSDRIQQAGLFKVLETEIDRLNKTELYTASIDMVGVMPAINDDKAIILYRMSQEILNNMVKHAHASVIRIICDGRENRFILAFSDNGNGFCIPDKMNSGSGLQNLQNRARLIDAQLVMQSSAGKGSAFIITLPL